MRDVYIIGSVVYKRFSCARRYETTRRSAFVSIWLYYSLGACLESNVNNTRTNETFPMKSGRPIHVIVTRASAANDGNVASLSFEIRWLHCSSFHLQLLYITGIQQQKHILNNSRRYFDFFFFEAIVVASETIRPSCLPNCLISANFLGA